MGDSEEADRKWRKKEQSEMLFDVSELTAKEKKVCRLIYWSEIEHINSVLRI